MLHREKINNFGITLFIILLVMPFLWLQPYYDDAMRFYNNYINFKYQGRLLAEYYYRFAGGYSKSSIVNLNVFNLLVIAVCLYFLLNKFSENIKSNDVLVSLCATIAIISSPFLLENLSYHVDNIGMILSFVFAVYASFFTEKTNVKNITITGMLIVISALFYQASLSVFCASVVVLALSNIINVENFDVKKFIFNKIISFIGAVIAITGINKIIMTDGYANDKSKLVTISFDGFDKLFSNFLKLNNLIFNSLNFIQSLLYLFISIIAIVGIYFNVLNLIKTGSRDWFKVFILIIALPLLILFTYFPTVLFSDAVVEPRVFMSFGFILAGMIIVAGSCVAMNKWVVVASLAFSVSVLMSSSAYVSTAQTMNVREEKILFRIESDIRYALNDNDVIKLSFLGRPELSPIEKSSSQAFPIIPRVLRRAYGDSWHNPAFVGANSQMLQYEELKNEADYLPVLKRPSYTILRSDSGKYLVNFIILNDK